jgi:hypothetical protein
MAAFQACPKGLLTGLFEDGESAELAYQACLDLGYEIGEVNVIVSRGHSPAIAQG